MKRGGSAWFAGKSLLWSLPELFVLKWVLDQNLSLGIVLATALLLFVIFYRHAWRARQTYVFHVKSEALLWALLRERGIDPPGAVEAYWAEVSPEARNAFAEIAKDVGF